MRIKITLSSEKNLFTRGEWLISSADNHTTFLKLGVEWIGGGKRKCVPITQPRGTKIKSDYSVGASSTVLPGQPMNFLCL